VIHAAPSVPKSEFCGIAYKPRSTLKFAGFDSIETARCYLHLFELTYRFTPFGPEVQPHLRGKCPLELAGYDLTQVPLARYLREHGTTPADPAKGGGCPKVKTVSKDGPRFLMNKCYRKGYSFPH